MYKGKHHLIYKNHFHLHYRNGLFYKSIEIIDKFTGEEVENKAFQVVVYLNESNRFDQQKSMNLTDWQWANTIKGE